MPQGYYHLESFLKMIARAGGEIGVCGTCMDACGIHDTDLVDGAFRGELAELSAWTAWADKVLVF